MSDEITVQVVEDLPWLPAGSTARLVVSDELPPSELVTTAFVLAFDRQSILMACIRGDDRGWSPPGGHLDPGETILEAAAREAREEACAVVSDLRPFGFQHIHRTVGSDGRYPFPDSYQVFLLAQVECLEPFAETDEVASRALFSPAEARGLHWVRDHLPFYEHALARVQSEKSRAANQYPLHRRGRRPD